MESSKQTRSPGVSLKEGYLSGPIRMDKIERGESRMKE